MKKEIFVKKASGERAVFSEKKLRTSLQRAGADDKDIDLIIEEVALKLHDGISTKEIYKTAFKLLKDSSRHLAAKYHLKSAIMELGPSGYPFEKFVAEVLKRQGYQVAVGQVVQGTCVKHEVDVIAKKDDLQHLIECKYHNLPGIFCDVKVPLYIQSRFKDVESQWKKSASEKKYTGWVVTNTRFSSDAIQYGTCAGLKLIGWDFPIKGNLKEQIDTLGLYPITCLTSLNKNEKQWLLDKKIVLCLELHRNRTLLLQAGLKPNRIDTVMQEVHQLCSKIVDK